MSDKIIGVYKAIDGKAYEDFDALRKDCKLIGSESDDVGDVKVYYTDDGTCYVVAHNCESYYGEQNAIKTR